MAGAGVAAACVLGIVPVTKRLAPPAGSDSAVSSNPSQGPVAHPPIAVAEPVRIVRFDIEHLAGRGEHEFKVGKLGERSFAVRRTTTSRSMRSCPAGLCYLIAFRPDGVEEICDPEDPGHAPDDPEPELSPRVEA